MASWAGVASAVYASAGKCRPTRTRKGNKRLTAILVAAAGSVGRMKGKNYLSAQPARLTQPAQDGPAQVTDRHRQVREAAEAGPLGDCC